MWRIEKIAISRMASIKVDAVDVGWPVRAGGDFEVWICAACGLTEWYAHNMNEELRALAASGAQGIQWIDTTGQRGPFR
jgi:hypothetical protein